MTKPMYRIIFSNFGRYLIQVKKWYVWRTVETATSLEAALVYLRCISATPKYFDKDGKEVKDVARRLEEDKGCRSGA